MPNNNPVTLNDSEWKEIFDLKDVKEGWGLEDTDTVDEWRNMVYAVKFNFYSGSPGYVGDLFFVMGDHLSAPPMILSRKNDGSLCVEEL